MFSTIFEPIVFSFTIVTMKWVPCNSQMQLEAHLSNERAGMPFMQIIRHLGNDNPTISRISRKYQLTRALKTDQDLN